MMHQLEMNAYMIKVIGDEQRRALNSISSHVEELCKERNIIHHSVKLLPINDLFTNAITPRPYMDTSTCLDEIESDYEGSEFEKSSNSEDDEEKTSGTASYTRLRDNPSDDDEDYNPLS